MTIAAGTWYTSGRPEETFSAGPFQVVAVSDQAVCAYAPEQRSWIAFPPELAGALTAVEPPPAVHLHDVIALEVHGAHAGRAWDDRRCVACGVAEPWAPYVRCRRVAGWRQAWQEDSDTLAEPPD
jgi:hypothetical protein